MATSTTKLNLFRELMKKHNINAYLIPGTDPHFSEYVPDHWQRRKWLSGFDGSAGDLVITERKAALWTDSRYFIQATEQLKNTGIELMKTGKPETPSVSEWLKQVLQSNNIVGLDPALHGVKEYENLKNELTSENIELKPITNNLVDKIWIEKPDFPAAPIEIFSEKYSGESFKSKLQRVREKFLKKADILVVSALDNTAWLFNIRSEDILYTPAVISYSVITDDKAYLFVSKSKITPEIEKYFENSVEIKDYDEFQNFAESVSQKTVMLDPRTTSKMIADAFGKNKLIFENNPVEMLKAIKNSTEIEGMKKAHLLDGAAMVKFLHWLDSTFGKEKITEISATEKLLEFRKENEEFRQPSFETIAACGKNAAIVHYTATSESDTELKEGELFLLDSGGQYFGGTTDITRTIALGKPSDKAKHMFTLVLKGHIDLLTTSFPEGTAGKQLDTIARKPLWDEGFNYGHGTGHGVGTYLGVHEGPHAISYYRCVGVSLEPGMVTSVEPGYYEENAFGIRIENLAYTVKDENFSNDEFNFRKFKNLTFCPIDTSLINVSELTERQRKYINDYHRECYEKLAPYIENKEIKQWLKNATAEI